jgi:surface antigen
MKRFVTGIIVCFLIFSLGGCATIPQEHKGAATGAGIGAATGALAGAVLAGEGSRTQGALIGGLVGAMVGGVIGNYTVDQQKSAEDTASHYNYQSSEGITVRVESTSVNPDSISPGGKVDLLCTYAVMAPQTNSQVALTEIREIRLNDELVGKPEVNTTHTPGTYSSNVPLFLPADAKRGTYKVITTIRSEASSDSRETSFTVR